MSKYLLMIKLVVVTLTQTKKIEPMTATPTKKAMIGAS